MWATRKFQHYVVGTCYTLETDHKPLEWLEPHKQNHAHSQPLERWSLELRAYDFRIAYRPGKGNQCANSLSRLPVSLVALENPTTLQQIATAQEQVPVLSLVCTQLRDHPDTVPASPNWRKFPFHCYKQVKTHR